MISAETQTRIGMPLDVFLEENSHQPFEFINGERILQMPTVLGHSLATKAVERSIERFIADNGGEIVGEVFRETTFIVPDQEERNWVTGSRIPDVMFYVGNRIQQYMQDNPDYYFRPLPIVPDFVIEVVSPTDRVNDLDRKIDAYLRDGVRLIWALNPERRKTIVYAPDAPPQYVAADELLDAGAVLPGFQLRLADLLP